MPGVTAASPESAAPHAGSPRKPPRPALRRWPGTRACPHPSEFGYIKLNSGESITEAKCVSRRMLSGAVSSWRAPPSPTC